MSRNYLTPDGILTFEPHPMMKDGQVLTFGNSYGLPRRGAGLWVIRTDYPKRTQRAQHRAEMAQWWKERNRDG